MNATPGSLAPRFPFPLDPIGWFCLGLGSALAPGAHQSRVFMGREVVLFRTTDGTPALIDAYCPHMGAHMGKGGAVCGQTLRCPFHHFTFTTDGACQSTPYGHEAPRAAKARTWPVCEVNGLLFAWHHPDGAAPHFALPTLPTADFVGPYTHAWTLRTHPQEITENSVDVGHFGVVHRYFDVSENKPMVVDGPRLFVAYGFGRAIEAAGLRLGAIRTEFTGEVHGLGYSTVDSHVKQAGIRSLHLVLPTPTAPGQTELRIVLWVRPDDDLPGWARALYLLPRPLRARVVGAFAFWGYKNDVSQDIEIWENKAYIHPPALAKGDGPVGRFRSWCRQFYATADLPTA